MGSVAAQDGNETAANESIEWPTDAANVSVDDARDALEEPPEELPTETIRAIGTWATNPSNFRELGASERERLNEWITEGQARAAIDGIDLPDLERDQSDGDADRDRDDDRADVQDDDRDDEREANESTVEDATVADTLENRDEIRINNQTSIVGWEFADGTARVAFETDLTAWATISDNVAGIGEEGAVHVPETSHELSRTETTVATMPVETFNGGQSVTVSVSGDSVRISTAMDESDDNPLRYFGGEQGLFTGMIMSIIMSAAATGFVLWREESGVIRA